MTAVLSHRRGGFYFWRMAKTYDDRAIGKAAADKLSAALRSKTSSFAEHVKGKKEGEASLKDAIAVARLKQYGLIKNNTKSHYLRAISIVMEKHGFVRHYGVHKNRAAGIRKRTKPNTKEYGFKSHMMNQPAQPFIDQVISNSGAVNYLAEKIAENRGEEIANEIVISLKKFG